MAHTKRIWPDFSEIPTAEAPFLRYKEIEVGQAIVLGGRTITPIPARHTVPAVGYHLDSGKASLVFTGDTGPNDALWREVNRITNLKFLIIETADSSLAFDRELKSQLYAMAGIPEYWIANIAMVQYEGTSAMMKSLTARSPASSPASPESRPVPNSASKPVIAKSGASDVKRAS